MPSRWIGGIHKGQGGKRWSLRENAHSNNPEDKSCNAGRPEYNMRLHVEFWTEPTKEIGHHLSSQLDYPQKTQAQDN